MSWEMPVPLRPSFQLSRLGLILVNAWFFLSGLWAFFLYWMLSRASAPAASLYTSPGLIDDLGKSTDVAALQKISVALMQAVAEARETGMTFAVWGLTFTLLSSGLSLLLLFWGRQPQPAEAEESAGPGGFFPDLLGGRLPLWKTFWLVYVPAPSLLAMAVSMLLQQFELKGKILPSLLLYPLFMGFLWLIFLVASTLAWRCSENTSRPLWGKLARVVIILVIAVPLLRAAIAFLPFLGLLPRN